MTEQTVVRPLSRGYHREERVEGEIGALLELSEGERKRRLFASGPDGEELSPECLIYMSRELLANGDANEAWAVVERLAVRMARRISRRLTVWKSLAAYQREEVEEALLERLYRVWMSREPADEFWEVRFNLSLDRALADEVDRVLRHARYEQKLDVSSDFEGEADPWDILPDRRAQSPETAALIADAVSRLPDRLREAFWLRFREEWTEEEIAGRLGCTSRTVRNYLRRAEAIIATWRGTET